MTDSPAIGPHDLGGLPGDPIDLQSADLSYWERMVDGMVYLLFRNKVYGDAAQLRQGIEALGPDVYERLGYYERWAASAARICIEKGLISEEELEMRVSSLKAKPEHQQ